MAENSVGDRATRPDDIHTMYSGKTVEINNTDAGISSSFLMQKRSALFLIFSLRVFAMTNL